MLNDHDYLTWSEVDLKAIRSNMAAIRRVAARNKFYLPTRRDDKKKLSAPAEILAVVKADAYGHGMKEVAQVLFDMDVGFFGVSDVNEGAGLRHAGITKPVLLFESALPSQVEQIVDYELMPTVLTGEFADKLNQYAAKFEKRVNVHVNVDTGMGRLGVWHQDAFDFIKSLYKFKYLTVHGLYTHFPSADTNKNFTKKQLNILYKLILKLDKSGLVIPYIHAANSVGLTGYKTNFLNIVRPGLMLYGLYPDASAKKVIKLTPALSVKSRVIFIKSVKKGRSISYGRTFIARKNMKVATLPIGYYDGYPRVLSNKASVIIKGTRCPVLGTVTMDQIMVDISKAKQVNVGDTATVIGKEKNQSVSADELAALSGTINYEIACSLGNRLPRIYLG